MASATVSSSFELNINNGIELAQPLLIAKKRSSLRSSIQIQHAPSLSWNDSQTQQVYLVDLMTSQPCTWCTAVASCRTESKPASLTTCGPKHLNPWLSGTLRQWSALKIVLCQKNPRNPSRLLLMRSYCRSIWPGYETLSCTGFSIFLIQMRHWHKHLFATLIHSLATLAWHKDKCLVPSQCCKSFVLLNEWAKQRCCFNNSCQNKELAQVSST